MTREAIQNMNYHDQRAHLDKTFLSISRQIMRIMKNSFNMPEIQDLDEKFVAAVNLLESQLVELKQLRVKNDNEPAVDWIEFIVVAAFAGRCPQLAQESLGKVLGTSDLPKTDELRNILQEFRGLALFRSDEKAKTPKTATRAKGRVQTARGTPASAGNLPCLNPTCYERHSLKNCAAWKSLSVPQRKDIVKTHNLCFFCLLPNHTVGSCPRKYTWTACRIDNCGQRHHHTLHESMATPSVRAAKQMDNE